MALVRALLSRRFMSTTASASPARQRQLFFIWAPDKTEEGTFERRLSVRSNHLESAKENISGGFIRAYLLKVFLDRQVHVLLQQGLLVQCLHRNPLQARMHQRR